jgi:single-strand DNA-binding protein
MAAFNKIIMMGNLTRDPEYKQLPSGMAVCRLGIASNRQIKNRQTGANIQEVCYVDVDVWGAQAESCRQYLQKGRGVLVEGRLKFDSWKDAEGATRSKHSIIADRVVFLQNAASQDDAETAVSAFSEPEAPVQFATQDTSKFQDVAKAVERKARKKVSMDDELAEVSAPTISGSASFKDEAPFDDELPF